MITVVVPIYNSERFLNRCITSIVEQTYADLEIILVDDGSTDSSPYMCDEWAKKDSRIRVIHKTNAGAGAARNTGIENASGEYVCFIDSDDYIDVTAIEKCVSTVLKLPADAVAFGSSNVYDSGEVKTSALSPKRSFFNSEEIKNEFLPSLFVYSMGVGVSVWGKMYSLDTIRRYEIRFKSEREIYSEDAFFNLEFFSKANSVAFLPENLYYYYENDSSLSRLYKEERQLKNDIFLTHALDFARTEGLPETVAIHIKARYHGCAIVSMKQIVLSDMPLFKKFKYLKKEYDNKILRSTLQNDVFAVEKKSLSLFFKLVKFKLYMISNILLWIRVTK